MWGPGQRVKNKSHMSFLSQLYCFHRDLIKGYTDALKPSWLQEGWDIESPSVSSKLSPASRLFLNPCCIFYYSFLKSGSVVSAKVVGLNVAAYECLGSVSVSSFTSASCTIAWSLLTVIAFCPFNLESNLTL